MSDEEAQITAAMQAALKKAEKVAQIAEKLREPWEVAPKKEAETKAPAKSRFSWCSCYQAAPASPTNEERVRASAGSEARRLEPYIGHNQSELALQARLMQKPPNWYRQPSARRAPEVDH